MAETLDADTVEAMRQVIIEANNSLYGSQGFFLTTKSGEVVGAVGVTGEPDKYHLARRIEELKVLGNRRYATLQSQERTIAELTRIGRNLLSIIESGGCETTRDEWGAIGEARKALGGNNG